MSVVAVALALLVASVNGGNDVAKGVATLAGSGAAGYRTAIGWGALTTLAGGIAAVWWGTAMSRLFSVGVLGITPTPRLAVAVAAGTAGWVGLATVARLPVSTTHALVGALLGAGLLAAPHAVHWAVLAGKVAVPLLASALVAYVLSALLGLAGPAGDRLALRAVVLPLPSLAGAGRRTLAGLHWASAGAVSAARGLNDTPKLAAVAGFVLLPAGVPPAAVMVGVAVAMLAGALLAGRRVARRLGEDVVALDDAAGLGANLSTALLVGAGAGYGLPMSTTHVSTGAIAGTAGTRLGRLHARTLRDVALAWTVTPLVAGLGAAVVYLLVKG
jgi:PiT family inorganic phosphate transporter